MAYGAQFRFSNHGPGVLERTYPDQTAKPFVVEHHHFLINNFALLMTEICDWTRQKLLFKSTGTPNKEEFAAMG